jgi:quinol-cytochrome oxidoreductase complex cytochrome b subunit
MMVKLLLIKPRNFSKKKASGLIQNHLLVFRERFLEEIMSSGEPNAIAKLIDWLSKTQVAKAIFRTGIPRNRRQRMTVMLNNVFLHLHPVRLPKHAVKIKYTWCMGGLSFFIFLVLTVTGILLMFYYRPTVEYAYGDVMDLKEQVPLGIMREIHRWGAHLMVITVWLHMFRVFMTGSYKPPREFNWIIGVILLVLTMLMSFTGYLLPWDQLAIWAITVGSNMAGATPFVGAAGPGSNLLALGDVNFITSASDARFAMLGGRFVGEGALLRFYVLHCIGLPFIIMIFMIVHFWRVRKDGGISGPV